MMNKLKIIRIGLIFLGVLFCMGCLKAEVTIGGAPVMVNLGSGSFVSYLVLDESSLGSSPLIYAWHYSGLLNTQGSAWTGTDLLNGVLADSAGTPYALSYTTGAFGLTTSFRVGSTNSTVVDPLANPGPVWTYWMKGGSEYVPYGDSSDFTFNASPTNWIVSPSTSDTRYLTNGSSDAWTISPYSYSGATNDTSLYTDTNGALQSVTFGTYTGDAPLSGVVPVPETSSMIAVMLLLLALLFSMSGVSSVRRG